MKTKTNDDYNDEYKNSLVGVLGIDILQSDKGKVRASMLVNETSSQPFGFLHGGASLTLAETLAGHGSRLLCEDGEFALGIQVSASHFMAVSLKSDAEHFDESASFSSDKSKENPLQKNVQKAFEHPEKRVYGTAILSNNDAKNHIWDVDIVTETGELVSAVRVVNRIMHMQ